MCHSGFQACQRDKAGSNSKSQLRCSFLKTLLLVWKVHVAELLFENASCSCLKPPITDSLLLSGSKEENILTAPFKSCWRPCRSSVQCPRSGPDLLTIASIAWNQSGSFTKKERNKTRSSLHHFSKTCFIRGKSTLLSSFLKMPVVPVSSHQSLIPCFSAAARKRTY